MMLPMLAPAPDPEPAVTLVDPLPDPYPPPFGLVGTLQNVAVISSSQITPVLVSGDVTVRPPTPSGCCGFDQRLALRPATPPRAARKSMRASSYPPRVFTRYADGGKKFHPTRADKRLRTS